MIELAHGVASAVPMAAAEEVLRTLRWVMGGVAEGIDDRIERVVAPVRTARNGGARPRGEGGAAQCLPPIGGK